MTRDYSNRYQRLLRKLEEARKNTGLKQTEVADKLKKPQSYVSKIESGERKISFTELEDLSKIYSVPITYFETTKKELEENN